jgi:indolepyruvate ferredoxin oxidoreductase, beta subunit
MNYDMVLAGVGGQGVLSLGGIIAGSAMQEGLHVVQSELHGMSQRGGAVVAHVRLSDNPIASSLVPRGAASLLLSLEPLEALRYLRYLAPHGALITASTPVRNIPDYPPLAEIVTHIRSLPDAMLVDADRLARAAGLAQATNMVIAGAASHRLPLRAKTLERFIVSSFARKGRSSQIRTLPRSGPAAPRLRLPPESNDDAGTSRRRRRGGGRHGGADCARRRCPSRPESRRHDG